MRSLLICSLLIPLLSSCIQTAHPRNYIISHIPEEEKVVSDDEK